MTGHMSEQLLNWDISLIFLSMFTSQFPSTVEFLWFGNSPRFRMNVGFDVFKNLLISY